MMTTRGLPKTAREMLLLINELHGRLLEVHDAIFKFRLRNLFKAMPFDVHHTMLETVTNTFEEIEVHLRGKPDHWRQQVSQDGYSLLLLYTSRIKAAAARLRDVAGRLELKAKGEPYASGEYQADLKAYQLAAEAYAALGPNMNNLFRTHG